VRFATVPYQPPSQHNLEATCIHLTNYAINKNHPNFVFNTDKDQAHVGHKRSLSSLWTLLAHSGVNVELLQ